MRLYGLLFNDRNSVRRRFASKLTACPGLRVHRRRRLCNGCRIANGWWGQNAGRLRVRMLQRMAYILRRNGYRPLPCFYRWPILTDTSSGGRLLGNRDPLSFFLDKRMLCCNLCYNRRSLPDWRFCAIIPGQRVHRRSRLYSGRRIANVRRDINRRLRFWLWIRGCSFTFLAPLHLADDLLRAAHSLPGTINSSIFNFVTTVIIRAPAPLRRIPELSSQTFGTVIQSTPDQFFWSCCDPPFCSLFYRGPFLYLLNLRSPPGPTFPVRPALKTLWTSGGRAYFGGSCP